MDRAPPDSTERPGQAPERSGLAPHRLQRVLEVIEARLAEPIHVQDLAAAVHMSPFHFARMFKKAVGQAPHAYITERRMDQAKALLAETPMALGEIARRVGYRTQAHFTGVFHKHVGTTPRAFRVKQREASGLAQPLSPPPTPPGQ